MQIGLGSQDMGFSGILHTELIHFNWIISLQGEYFHSLIEIAPAI